jgi:hypothetical protein
LACGTPSCWRSESMMSTSCDEQCGSSGSLRQTGSAGSHQKHQDHDGRCRRRSAAAHIAEFSAGGRWLAVHHGRRHAVPAGTLWCARLRPGSPEGRPTGWYDERYPTAPLRVAAAGRWRIGRRGSRPAWVTRMRPLCSRHTGISCWTARIERAAQSMPRGPLTAYRWP